MKDKENWSYQQKSFRLSSHWRRPTG